MAKTEQTPSAKRLADYTPPAFTIKTVNLNIILEPAETLVTNTMKVVRVGEHSGALELDGESLTLESIQVNGRALAAQEFNCSESSLSVFTELNEFELTVVTKINPEKNTSLEGLYLSDGAYCTQCEAEGFRRITYFMDRPDVLATYTTRIEADKGFTYLLSNGNKVGQGELSNGKHFAEWHDPHPKPCYLFALVAGDFDLLEDSYTTAEGRNVALQLFVDRGNSHRGEFALEALKRSMAWDEQRFGLCYDLDIYMVVAVDFFNMGAMENKGLNVFNSKYVLAEPKSATDTDYHNIEAVIGHEYFHNWTGNRVTCRDWFQLSLKEGLTVFRDQEFSADMGSAAVNRLQNVRIIQTQQFAEDAGPMAHPIRPSEVIEMNNFYTVTVYNKGSEVIRMIHTLLGEQGFRKGMDLYFQRHDGQAVTCDDFVLAMQDATGVDLSQFKRWYSQSGTPELYITDDYDAGKGVYRLHVKQHTPATSDQREKLPQHIPLKVALYDPEGSELDISNSAAKENGVLHVTEFEQTFEFESISQKPLPALLLNFSAPVRCSYPYIDDQRAFLVSHAKDAFVKWDAMQALYADTVFKAEQSSTKPVVSETLANAFRDVLNDKELDKAIIAEILAVPAISTLVEKQHFTDIHALIDARDGLVTGIGEIHRDLIQSEYNNLQTGDYAYEAKDVALRALKACLLNFISATSGAENLNLVDSYNASDNMTEKLSMLAAANHWQLSERDTLLSMFEKTWRQDALVMDKWLSIQALSPKESAIQEIKAIFEHPVFSFTNPNRVRALIGTFAAANYRAFHNLDGTGYQLLADVVIKMNSINPQVAARIITPLTQWKRFDEKRQALMKEELTRIVNLDDLAKDLYEVVNKSLAQ
ncbi:aminopeptidase N [Corallincola platygyrae]|uniref:Aminopeptidase N n=1 Tax=Corallincola platygyrae TaxID=1193278 RepID=A0ABW4XMX8_9GAMM